MLILKDQLRTLFEEDAEAIETLRFANLFDEEVPDCGSEAGMLLIVGVSGCTTAKCCRY